MRKLFAVLLILTFAGASLASVTVYDEDIFKIKLGGYAQFHWDYDLQTNVTDGNAFGELYFKRAKLEVSGDIGDYWSFKLVEAVKDRTHFNGLSVDTADYDVDGDGNPDITYVSDVTASTSKYLQWELEELYLSFKPADIFNLHLGLQNPDGSWTNSLSSSAQPFIDRPQHDVWSSDYQEGIVGQVMIDGAEKDTRYLDLSLGVWENDRAGWGGGTGPGNNPNLSDINFSVFADSSFIKGIHLGGFLYLANDQALYEDALGNDVYTGVTGYGAHVNYTHDYFYAGLEYVGGSFGLSSSKDAAGDTVDLGDDFGVSGLAVDLLGRLPVGGDFLNLVELGGRYDMNDTNDTVDLNGMDQLTIGANLYFTEDHYAMLQLNYIMQMPEDSDVDGNSLVKAQLQLKF
ncbi:MAG: porin [bacterium]|nr:porin [bacterium]